MRQFLSSQTQSLISTGLTQHKQARLRPTEQIGETQELAMLGCTFSGQASGTFLKAELQQRSSCRPSLRVNTPIPAEQAFQPLVCLKRPPFHSSLCPGLYALPLWNAELHKLQGQARRERAACTKSYLQLNKTILRSHLPRLRTNSTQETKPQFQSKSQDQDTVL